MKQKFPSKPTDRQKGKYYLQSSDGLIATSENLPFLRGKLKELKSEEWARYPMVTSIYDKDWLKIKSYWIEDWEGDLAW